MEEDIISSKEEFQNLLNLLKEHNSFFLEFSCLKFENFIRKNKKKIFNSFQVKNGMTKGVLIPLSKDYVIKIPFMGYESFINGFHLFDGAFEPEEDAYKELQGSWNYCQREEEIYNLAKEYHVAEFFAQVKQIDNFENYPIYLQPYANIGSKSMISLEDDARKVVKVRKFCEEMGFYAFNTRWMADALEYYGFSKVKEFCFFMNKFYLNDDLHEENIGYIDNRPVLVDYGGYSY